MLIAGGGTGGHLFPGMAVADTFMRTVPDATVGFVGTERGIEARVIPQTDYPFFTVPILGLVGKGLINRLRAIAAIPSALAAASAILRNFSPDLVVGVGGYASAPILFMAGLRRTPRVILEQNAVPGVTNRLFGPGVARVFLTFKEAESAFRGGHFLCPGNPVRRDVIESAKQAGEKKKKRPGLLVFGGSQGAQAINDALLAALPDLLEKMPDLTVTLQTGTGDFERVAEALGPFKKNVTVQPFIEDMGDAYAAADLVVCRAGATTTAELTALGKPSVLIPYPHAAHDHQTANARAMEASGASLLLPQSQLSGNKMTETVHSLLNNPDRLATMGDSARRLGRPQAAGDIVTECLRLVGSTKTSASP